MQLRTSADATLELVLAVVAVLRREETSFLAAGIAYYVLLVGAALNAVLAGRGADTGTNKAPPADMTDNDRP